jgi:F-type H+-transporting ATPase subunit delta
MKRLARIYAEALTEGAMKLPDPEAPVRELEQLARVMHEAAELRTFFDSPAVPAQARREWLDRALTELGASEPVRNLLALLVENRRLGLLEEILEALREELDRRLGIVEAEVRTARELDVAERRALEEVLEQRTGHRVRARYHVDPGLLGGAVVAIGSTVFDGSVRSQLERLRARMLGSQLQS